MSDYIKREDAMRKIERIDDHDNDERANALGLAEFAIQTVPSVDVVEVVRCKDCKYNDNGWCGNIEFGTRHVELSDYCSDGERKDNE